MRHFYLFGILVVFNSLLFSTDIPFEKQKQNVVQSIVRQEPDLARIADRIWALAETALKEVESAEVLASYLENQGFRVERDVAGMPTALVAEWGQGSPVIGIMGEYDALPGLSQKATPVRSPLSEGAGGHGCGHNLFGTASAGAAVALKDTMENHKIGGTIRFYGTPAEEDIGGKIFMIKSGLFKDVDAAFAWHPSTSNDADVQSSQAVVDFRAEFTGRAAHAAFDPWNGRSALDGADLFIHALNLMREHVRPTVRIHYVVEAGGLVPNIVPEKSVVWCWIRDSTRQGVDSVLGRARKAAEGAAIATETAVQLRIQGGNYEVLPNRAGGLLMFRNMEWIGPVTYTPEEKRFAATLQDSAGVAQEGLEGAISPWKETAVHPEGGSTDVGDVSWVVPVINMTATTAPKGVPWHSWAVVAPGGMSIGHKGMILAAKSMATTAVDLLLDKKALEEVTAEFKEKAGGHRYDSYIKENRPPLP